VSGLSNSWDNSNTHSDDDEEVEAEAEEETMRACVKLVEGGHAIGC
jgi:hypothetical protein